MLAAIHFVPVTSNTLFLLVEVAVGLVSASLYIKSRIPQQTINEQTILIQTLKDRLDVMDGTNKDLIDQQTADRALIHKLEGQVEILRDLPLQSIAEALKLTTPPVPATATVVVGDRRK